MLVILLLVGAVGAFLLLRKRPIEIPAAQADKNLAWWQNEERRFRLAYEQCIKGPERKAELKRRLDIAQAGLKMAELREVK